MPTPNAELIRRTVARIVDDPERWKQATFETKSARCGTVRCFGGHAVALHNDLSTLRGLSNIEEMAQAALGLSDEQAEELFYTFDDTLPEYVARVERVTGVPVIDLLPRLRARVSAAVAGIAWRCRS